MKDLVQGDQYNLEEKNGKYVVGITKANEEEGAEGHELYMEEISKKDQRQKWWKKRMGRFDESYLPPPVEDSESKP